MTAKSGSKRPFEDSLKRLEEIVSKLEQGEVPLEEAISLYEEGLALSKMCMERLTQTDLRIKTMMKDMAGTFRFMEGEPE